jgi:hypothetical protein
VIYFIRNARARAVKIGRAGDVARRLRSLQTASPDPLTLITWTTGGARQERFWHGRFRHLHIRGEWYEEATELWEAVFPVARPNVWAECLRRNRCRQGLAGLWMVHEPSDQTFLCGGSAWTASGSLRVYRRPPVDPFAGRLVVRASDVVKQLGSPRLPGFRAEECTVVSPWLPTCCDPAVLAN